MRKPAKNPVQKKVHVDGIQHFVLKLKVAKAKRPCLFMFFISRPCAVRKRAHKTARERVTPTTYGYTNRTKVDNPVTLERVGVQQT